MSEVFRDPLGDPVRDPLRDPLRGRFPPQRLSVLLPLIVLPLELSLPLSGLIQVHTLATEGSEVLQAVAAAVPQQALESVSASGVLRCRGAGAAQPHGKCKCASIGENQKGRREGDGKKMSRQFATNVTTIYDILRQLATSYDNYRLFVPLT